MKEYIIKMQLIQNINEVAKLYITSLKPLEHEYVIENIFHGYIISYSHDMQLYYYTYANMSSNINIEHTNTINVHNRYNIVDSSFIWNIYDVCLLKVQNLITGTFTNACCNTHIIDNILQIKTYKAWNMPSNIIFQSKNNSYLYNFYKNTHKCYIYTLLEFKNMLMLVNNNFIQIEQYDKREFTIKSLNNISNNYVYSLNNDNHHNQIIYTNYINNDIIEHYIRQINQNFYDEILISLNVHLQLYDFIDKKQIIYIKHDFITLHTQLYLKYSQ